MKKMGYPDRPVASITEDLFNVEVYVNALCSFIRSCETPMTVSIQGDVWPIWFNTWQFSQFDMGNSLAFSMMDVLLKGLDCDKDVRKKILNGLIGFGKKALKLSIIPHKEEWGRYIYTNVLRINANDSSATDQIATITRNAYASVNEVILRHITKQENNQ